MFSCQINDKLKLVLPMTPDAEEISYVVRDNLDELKVWMAFATDNYSIDSARDTGEIRKQSLYRLGCLCNAGGGLKERRAVKRTCLAVRLE